MSIGRFVFLLFKVNFKAVHPIKYLEAFSKADGGRLMIQGINFQSDMYSAYNRIQASRPDKNEALSGFNGFDASQVKGSDADETVSVSPVKMDLRLDDIKPHSSISMEDISLSLNESAASFEMKGSDSDIKSLDMEKAMSDMKRDESLMQYQYFIGDSAPFINSEDGVVIPKN